MLTVAYYTETIINMSTWYTIGNNLLTFRGRPIFFLAETIDGLPYKIILNSGESGTYTSGVISSIIYFGDESHPSFTFENPLNIRLFEVSDTLFIKNSSIGWTNIERLVAFNAARGDFNGIGTLTALTSLFLQSVSGIFTGDMTLVSNCTSLTSLYILGNGFTGNMTGVANLNPFNDFVLSSNKFLLTYTTFAINVGRCNIRLQPGQLSTSTAIDGILIDIDSVATTKAGTIDLRSPGAAAPTSVSLEARTSLVAKGRTILTN